MQTKLSTSFVLALAVTSLANPILSPRGGKCPKDLKTSEKDWCSGNGKDKIVIRVSDKWAEYGTIDPKKLIDSVKDRCDGGACDETEWKLETEWQDDDKEGESAKGKVVVKIVDQVGMWRNFDKMFESVVATLDEINDPKEVEVMDYTNNGIDFSGSSRKIKQHKGPAQIVFEELGSSADKPPLTSVAIQFTKEEDASGSKALCEALMGAGSAVAGAVNGIFGAGMGLASLACAAAEE